MLSHLVTICGKYVVELVRRFCILRLRGIESFYKGGSRPNNVCEIFDYGLLLDLKTGQQNRGRGVLGFRNNFKVSLKTFVRYGFD